MRVNLFIYLYFLDNQINLQELGVTVHAVTGALKQFFKMLPEPLIPYEFGMRINDVMSEYLQKFIRLFELTGGLLQYSV